MGRNSVRTNKVIEELRENKLPLAPQCTDDAEKPCSRTHSMNGLPGDFCTVYHNPTAMWRIGDCPMADVHLRKHFVAETPKEKQRVGQQKQKKKSRK